LRLTHKNGIEVNFTSCFHERLIFSSKELGNSPSNAHAYRLYLVKDALKKSLQVDSLQSAKPCIVAPIFGAERISRFLFTSASSLRRTNTKGKRKRPVA